MRWICFFLICGIIVVNLDFPDARAQSVDKNTTDPVVEMEPYVVKGERILPEPESWLYVRVPALELTRGERKIIVPGYEILASKGKKNTLAFVDEIQLRQLAGAILFPYLVEALPRSPIVLILDNYNTLLEPAALPAAKAWMGDPVFTARALHTADEQADSRYSVGTQTTIFYNDVSQRPSYYDDRADRIEMEEDDEVLLDSAGAVGQLGRRKYLPRAAVNGGPLTIYLYGSGGGSPLNEAWLAREAWNGLNGYALHRLVKTAPPWLREGLAQLYGMVRINYRFIDFGHPPNQRRRQPMENIASISEVLQAEDIHALGRISGGKEMAATFVHYCLYADNGKYAGRFFKFIERLEKEPFAETLFKECFGKKISSFESAISTDSFVFTWYKYTRYKGRLPDMPEVLIRDATQSEVARLKAEVFIARNWTPLALDELRIAYWRGEREPNMLALLAFLEEHIGSIPRAQKITRTLLTMPEPPPRTYIVAAKLRLRELGAGEKSARKFDRIETASVLELVTKARERGLLNEDLCATLSKLIIHSAEPPSNEIAVFIQEAAKQYPLNKTIAEACKLSVEPT